MPPTHSPTHPPPSPRVASSRKRIKKSAGKMSIRSVPPLTTTWTFDLLCYDLIGVLAEFSLSCPLEIASFALVSSQFNEAIVRAHCLEVLALALYPSLTSARAASPVLGNKSVVELLRARVNAERRHDDGLTNLETDARQKRVLERLKDEFSFYLTFDLKSGKREDLAVARRETEWSGVVARQDAGFVVPSWTYSSRDPNVEDAESDDDDVDNKFVMVNFDLSDKQLEFPSAWPALSTFGGPRSKAYASELSRRRAFDVDFGGALQGDDAPEDCPFVVEQFGYTVQVVVVNKATGETAMLTDSSASATCSCGRCFDDYDEEREEEWTHRGNGNFIVLNFHNCPLPEEDGPPSGLTLAARLSSKYHFSKTEGVSGPELRCKVDKFALRFFEIGRYSVEPIGIPALYNTFRSMFF